MIEILRESPQPTWTLILFFLIITIYIYLYNDDARRLRYFFLSLFNKQYQVSYGRQSKVSGNFIPLLSLTNFLSGSFLRLRSLMESILIRFSSIADSAIYLKDLFDFHKIFQGKLKKQLGEMSSNKGEKIVEVEQISLLSTCTTIYIDIFLLFY